MQAEILKSLWLWLVLVILIGCEPNVGENGLDYHFIAEGSQHPGSSALFLGAAPGRPIEQVWIKGLIVDNQRDFENIYYLDGNNIEPPPQIDFGKFQVVAINIGQQFSGGYSITVAKIIELDHSIEVLVSIAAPGPGCPVNQEITIPYAIFSISATDKELEFLENYTNSACI